jgi:hypothetical protein
VDHSAGYTWAVNFVTDAAGPIRAYSAATNAAYIGRVNTVQNMIDLKLSNPQATTRPIGLSHFTGIGATNNFGIADSVNDSTASFDGITILAGSGNISGTVSIYGFRK